MAGIAVQSLYRAYRDALSYFSRRRLLCGALFFMAGIGVGADTRYAPLLWLLAAGAFGLAALLNGNKAARAFILIGLFGAGAAYCSMRAAVPAGFPGDGTYTVQARVRAPVVVKDGAARFDVSNITLITPDGSGESSTMPGCSYVWIKHGSANALHVGDWISFNASVRLPTYARNPGGFDARRWAFTRGDHYTMFGSSAVTLLSTDRFSSTRAISSLQMNLAARIDSLFGDGAPLLRAILIGDKTMLPSEWREAFARTGIVHLLAVSGLHVGFLYGLLKLLFDRLPLSPLERFICLALMLAGYSTLTGLSPSILRASLMLLAVSFGTVLARRADRMTCLAASAVLILIARPLDIVSASFRLTFSALAGVILLGEPLGGWFKRRMKFLPQWMRSSLTMTITAQLGLFIPSAQLAGYYPLLSLVTNLIAIPLSSMIFPLAIPVVLVDAIYHPLAVILAWPERIVLTILRLLADVGSSLGLLARVPSLLPLALIVGYYLCIFIMSNAIRLRGWIRAATSIAVLAIGIAAVIAVRLQARYVQLDVGQALSGVLHTPSSTIVVDTGIDGAELVDYLMAAGNDIDALFISHGNSDHFGGLPALLDSSLIKVHRIYVSDSTTDDVNPAYEESLNAARARGIPVVPLSRGDVIEFSPGLTVSVLWPPQGYYNQYINETSLVLRADVGNNAILFPGDVGTMEPLRGVMCDVLVVAHHGSQYSTSDMFLEYAQPTLGIISANANNRYLPHPLALERLENAGISTFRTDESGAVTVYFNNETMSVQGFLPR